MTNIILCGGSGTRLWPISRTLMPKQFVKLFDNGSLFELTVKRNLSVCDKQLIVSNAEQYFLALDQLEELGIKDAHFLLEPLARNTAPAIALACFGLDANEMVLVSPSDHLIKNQKAYESALGQAKELADKDALVTFGITVKHPETGYGYIQADGTKVKAFYEKPDIVTAKRYIDSGDFYWNSGMFMFKAGVLLQELKRYAPDIYDAAYLAFVNAKKDSVVRVSFDDMQNIPSNSIDYAVMEKSQRVRVVACDMGWSDLGSFDALEEELPKDEDGNTKCENLYTVESRNNFIYKGNRGIALVGVDDLIVADTPDALLISKKGMSSQLKEIVAQLKTDDSPLHHIHQTAHRPWGTYTVLEDTQGYKIKRIVVKPGKRLSLQKHFHRNEHWIVVSGTATVTVGDEIKLIRPNESTYIKMGELHRLANEGIIPVVLIEAQVGEYTGEDDIIRIEDDFKR